MLVVDSVVTLFSLALGLQFVVCCVYVCLHTYCIIEALQHLNGTTLVALCTFASTQVARHEHLMLLISG